MKLKTLKDFEWDDVGRLVLEPVKAEAIKHIKDFESRKDFLNPTLLNWITYFFNITKEDLKS